MDVYIDVNVDVNNNAFNATHDTMLTLHVRQYLSFHGVGESTSHCTLLVRGANVASN